MQIVTESGLFFPHPEIATREGILALAGDLSIDRLLLAYNYGIFPWYNEGEPIIWWCPKPRFVIYPHEVKVAKSMRSYFNQQRYHVTYNQAFVEVISHCKGVDRKNQDGTWINDQIVEGYSHLHRSGYATSVEVWDGDELVGGLYGVNIGKVFFGESMFSLRPNASKFGFITLAIKLFEEGYDVIDCQQPNPYLTSLGGRFIEGAVFDSILRTNRLRYLAEQPLLQQH
jgi:leucyl/phenylalanyl-tRNA---protein transferase